VLNHDEGTNYLSGLRATPEMMPALHEILAPLVDLDPRMPFELVETDSFTGGGSDHASFSCYGAPAVELGGLGWDYGDYTWHTNRDTYDKVVFDDLKSNATLFAMLAYLASEDPQTISRERVDLKALAAAREALADSARANPADSALARRAGLGRGRFGRIPTEWPACQKAPRSTNPRLK
jgi:hypothetical protein